MPHTYREYNAEATLVRTSLDRGEITCLEALENIATLRQHGKGALADVLTDVVQTWHAAYAVRMHGPTT